MLVHTHTHTHTKHSPHWVWETPELYSAHLLHHLSLSLSLSTILLLSYLPVLLLTHLLHSSSLVVIGLAEAPFAPCSIPCRLCFYRSRHRHIRCLECSLLQRAGSCHSNHKPSLPSALCGLPIKLMKKRKKGEEGHVFNILLVYTRSEKDGLNIFGISTFISAQAFRVSQNCQVCLVPCSSIAVKYLSLPICLFSFFSSHTLLTYVSDCNDDTGILLQ